MIPEFIGRVPMVAVVDPLDEEALMAILTQPRSALVKQYQKLLKMDNVQLDFKGDALRRSHRKPIGGKLERERYGDCGRINVRRNVRITSRKDVTRCTVTREMVEK